MLVPLGQLWLPILLAAVACHFLGFLMWMVLPHHRSDYKAFPDEGALRNLLKGKIAPGMYLVPFCTHAEMQSPEMKVKRDEGPVGFMTILPTGMGNMVTMQAKNVLYHAVVSLFVAYIAVVTLAPGTEYLKVFQVTGTAAFLAYGFAWGHQVIWFGRPFKVAMKELCDGLVMALVTAGIFGWRWPGM
ncbi:MAG: hypothetical protein ABIQ41_12330 [Gemmatimonadales bacterium]